MIRGLTRTNVSDSFEIVGAINAEERQDQKSIQNARLQTSCPIPHFDRRCSIVDFFKTTGHRVAREGSISVCRDFKADLAAINKQGGAQVR